MVCPITQGNHKQTSTVSTATHLNTNAVFSQAEKVQLVINDSCASILRIAQQGECRQQTLPAAFIQRAAGHQPMAAPHLSSLLTIVCDHRSTNRGNHRHDNLACGAYALLATQPVAHYGKTGRYPQNHVTCSTVIKGDRSTDTDNVQKICEVWTHGF